MNAMSLHQFSSPADGLHRARPLSPDARERLRDILWGRPIFKAPRLPDPPLHPPGAGLSPFGPWAGELAGDREPPAGRLSA